LPLALLEAMFTGLPIIASDVGEVGVALAHGQAGVLVPPGDVAALAAGLDRLLLDPKQARELGDRASARAVREYGLPGMVQRYSAIYESLLASPTASRRGLPTAMRTMSCPRPGP
jgi:glycosyltransferase involved in cell wall biosynthesis